MTNDFYVIKVSSSRKTDLLKAGVARESIHSIRDGFRYYGMNRYPIRRYEATVGFAETNGNPDAVAAQWQGRGVTVAVKYICRD